MSYCECSDDFDPPSFFSQSVVKARKPHKCTECGGPITKGDSYRRSSGKWDGRVDVYTECGLCMELRQWAEISMPCFCCNIFGELHDTVREMVDDIWHTIPGFRFEWGRRIVKIQRHRYGEHWPRKYLMSRPRGWRLTNSKGTEA